MQKDSKKTIIFSGGGTGGSVTPIIAVAEELMKNRPDYNYIFIGTKKGPERELLASSNLEVDFKFYSLIAGKWRRYFSWQNFFDIFKIIIAFFYSCYYIYKLKPRVIFSAGAFVSVPLAYAAYFFRVPVVIHQLDLRPGLANKLMSKVAKVVSLGFEKSKKSFPKKGIVIGNPVRIKLIKEAKLKKESYRLKFGLEKKKPLILVIGGGTGAVALNKLVSETWPFIRNKWQLVHIYGKNKELDKFKDNDYRAFSFLPNLDLISIMAASDLIITRAGLGVLTEISALAKPAIIIPMPNSHQEDNASIFSKEKAAIVYNQKDLNTSKLIEKLNLLSSDKKIMENLSKKVDNIISKGAEKELAMILENYMEK